MPEMNMPSLTPRLPSNAGTFTAAQIAIALGRPPRAIRRELESIDADAAVTVSGNIGKSWLVSSLPAALRSALAFEAERRGYESEEHLLKAPNAPWDPPIPLSQIDSVTIKSASDLQRALRPTLERLTDAHPKVSELTSSGLEDYAKAIGYRVSARHFERLLRRTLDRDRGAERWDRLELFLPDRIRQKKSPVIAMALEERWAPMLALAAKFSDKLSPTSEEKCLFWDQALACHESAIESGASPKRVRRELRNAIEAKVPFIKAAGRALETQIRRRLDRWIEGGRTAFAVADRRAEGSGRPKAAELPEEFRLKLLARAHANNGRIVQSYRELLMEGEVPAVVANAYPFKWDSKSRLAASIRAAIAQDLKILESQRIGSHNARLKGPSINRDYTDVSSGEIFQSDDMTGNLWFYVTNPDGSFRMLRGQFLPWICARTHYIVTGQLIPEKGYDSIDILRGIARLHDEYGLPEQLYFENSIWASKLIDGTAGDRVPWAEYAYGLSEVGVRVRHAQARNPRAKIVENVFGQLQNRMDRLRGYAGRNAKQCPEDTSRALKIVARGEAHPAEFFYSHQECVSQLERICDAFNAEPQNGKMLGGLSPSAAFVKFRKSPPVILPPELRYLLARSRVETTVRASGIRVNKFNYKGEEASALVGKRVFAWFNAEDPESICVTDLDRKNPITVRRETAIPAFDATAEQIAEAQRENHAQTKYARTLFTTLKKDFPEEFLRKRRHFVRPSSQSIAPFMLGAEMEQQRIESDVDSKQRESLRRKSEQLSRKIGLGHNRTVDPQRVEALTELDRAGIKAVNPYDYEGST